MRKIVILLCGIVICSCSDWLETTGDDTTLPDSKYFSDETAFANALTDVYTQLRAPSLYGGTLTLDMLEFMAQNFTPGNARTEACSRFDYADEEIRKAIGTTYRDLYKAIASCNKIIEEIEKTDVVFFNSGQKEQVTGEAYALRAALHFDLLRLFHPAPAAGTDYKALPYMTRFTDKADEPQTTAALLALIIKDLGHAEQLLHGSDPILWSRNASSVRPGETDRGLRTFAMNYYAVKAMQARVFLYGGNYEEAYSAADKVFDHLRNTESRNRIFYWVTAGKYGNDYSFSREHLFGISSLPNGFTALSEKMFVTESIETRRELRCLFTDPADIRYRAWFTSDGNDAYWMDTKFGTESMLNDYISSSTGENTTLPVRIPFIKLGEVALIAAEALNETGRTTEALDYLTEAETGKSVSYAAALKSTEQPEAAAVSALIEEEYRREFWGEGQLFYFYKRRNATRILSWQNADISMAASAYTWPVPENGTNVTP